MFFFASLSLILLAFTVQADDEKCTSDKALKHIETNLAIDSITASNVKPEDARRGKEFYEKKKDSLEKASAAGLLHDVSHEEAMKRVDLLLDQELITKEQRDAFESNRPSTVLGIAAPLHYSSVVMTRMPNAQDRVTLAYTILKMQPSKRSRFSTQALQLTKSEERQMGFYVKTKALENFLDRNAEQIQKVKQGLEMCRGAATENPDTKKRSRE